MNSITDLLNLEDSDIVVSDIRIEGTKKYLTPEAHLTPHHCPCCAYRMYSKGITTRTISHPILQDGCELILLLKQHRWKCTNPQCNYTVNDSYRFVKLERLPLTDIISIDVVYLEMDGYCKYALVIQDFYTGDPIDVLRSRRSNVTEPYFASIPIEERLNVKYLISDMYNSYISFVDKYFPNAVPVVDAFHVIQWMIHHIDQFFRSLIKEFRQRDRENYERLHPYEDANYTLPISDEIYLLQHYRWLILSNQSNITHHSDLRMDKHFHVLMNTYDYERRLSQINPHLERLRDLKELYISFNDRNAGNPLQAALEIEDVIQKYHSYGEVIFRKFADTLVNYKEPIINSFVMVEKYGNGKIYNSCLSNGPIESLNRKVKDLKRLGRGFRNFEHFRNRFLYATRNNPILDARSNGTQVQYFENDDF